METNSSSSNKNIVDEILSLVDPKHGTPFERSRNAFISINQVTGTIMISAFLARLLGLVDGDRILMLQGNTKKMVWFIAKTTQREKTRPVKIQNGVYRINTKKWVADISEAFRFEPSHKGYLRLYVNTDKPMKIAAFGNVSAFQLFDIPELRTDFIGSEGETAEQKLSNYIKFIQENPYIVKQ